MNPGPAPRPPTDRPRLNLMPNTNLPGSMSNMAISPIPGTATSTYSGSTISLPIARQQTGSNDGMGGVAVKKEGYATVKENKNFIQPWKSKYLILRKESLDFHKTEGGKVSYTLYLKDVLNVGRVETTGIIFEIKRRSDGISNSPGDDDGQGTKTLQLRVKGDDELYEWIDLIYGASPNMGGVSNPTNFSHAIHVGFDSQTGQFTGLPPEWSKLLNSSAITKEDYYRNPQAVFEVLDFYTDLAKRAENPNQYPSLTPTPPPASQANKQLGYGGASVAPPRPVPPTAVQRNQSYNTTSSQSSNNSQRQPGPNDQQQQRQQMQAMSPNYVSQDALKEEQRKKQQQQQQQREADERRDLDAYNASLPAKKTPLAMQEVGGGGYSNTGTPGQQGGQQPAQSDRFNPSRAAPPAPKGQQQQGSPLRAQRPAPPPPSAGGAQSRPPVNPQSPGSSGPNSSRDQAPRPTRNDGPSAQNAPRYPNGNQQSPQRQPQGPSQGTSRLPAPVKPLNVAPKPSQQPQPQSDSVKAAAAALNKPAPAPEKKQDARMSTMSESEVMAKLKEAVSKDDPNASYSKQKKIGQGASGSVYVAKIKETAVGVARDIVRQQGPRAQVAIKQMDLAHQPRKELIVNEIMVMKDSRHKNIVNFLDAFLRNNNAELWVVMEYMEGGALTDVIDNNPSISEEQIATICHEVCFSKIGFVCFCASD